MAINLKKGQKINLTKSDNSKLNTFCVGANWGAIKTSNFLGRNKTIPVDLDLSAVLIDDRGELHEIIFFQNLTSLGIIHFGDDRVGDTDGDDGLDNEVIKVELDKLPSHIEQIVFILNSFEKQDFADIPFASIRLYEGDEKIVKNVFAEYNIARDNRYKGYISMILGKLYKRNGAWKFNAIGEPTKDSELKHTVATVMARFSK
jgi:tellurium resistance protein TerZ